MRGGWGCDDADNFVAFVPALKLWEFSKTQLRCKFLIKKKQLIITRLFPSFASSLLQE